MSVECNKTDMDNYAAEVDEEDSGKFTFLQFCSVRKNTLYLILVQFPSRYIQGQFNVPGKGIKLSKFVSSPLIDWSYSFPVGMIGQKLHQLALIFRNYTKWPRKVLELIHDFDPEIYDKTHGFHHKESVQHFLVKMQKF